MLTASNLFFQTMSIVKPLSDTQVPVNILYMVGTLISIGLLMYAYKNQKTMKKITYGVLVYLVFRNSLRILDFEETMDKYETKDRWYFSVLI